MKGKGLKLLFFAALVISLVCGNIFKKVDSIFREWDRPDSPGCALGIIKDGKLIYAKGYGMANLDYNIPITPKTVFRIASTSKQFTAMCIALLEEQGKLSLEDDVRKYIPELPDYGTPIKIKHLIYHTSGIRDYLTLQFLAGKTDDDFYTPAEALELLSRQKALNFKPGDEFLYSNSGYFLLGLIVERVSGKSLAQFAKENIFDPLGMKSTHFHDDHTMIVKNRATGYCPAKKGFRICETNLDIVGDGAVFTTVEDLYRWDQNFYHNRLGKGGQKLIKRMLTTGTLNSGKKLNYAFGLMISRYRGLEYIHHGGAFVGFRAQMIRFPEQRFTVIVLANLSSINPTKLCLKVADLFLEPYFKEPKKIPSRPKVIKLPLSALKKRTGIYFNEKEERVVQLFLKGEKLMAELSGMVFRLEPLSERKFISLKAPIEFIFEFEERDGKEHLTVKARGRRPAEFVKMKPPQLSPEKLKEFAGRYYSDELMFTYRIVFEKGALRLRHRNAPKAPLVPFAPDYFKTSGLVFHFTRDEGGRVSGFKLSAGRVRDIVFVKVERRSE